jgi:hypothetical protein
MLFIDVIVGAAYNAIHTEEMIYVSSPGFPEETSDHGIFLCSLSERSLSHASAQNLGLLAGSVAALLCICTFGILPQLGGHSYVVFVLFI